MAACNIELCICIHNHVPLLSVAYASVAYPDDDCTIYLVDTGQLVKETVTNHF